MSDENIMYTGYDTSVLAQPSRPNVLTISIPTSVLSILWGNNTDGPLSIEEHGEFIKFTQISKEEAVPLKSQKRKAVSCDICGSTTDVVPFISGHICSNCIKIIKTKGVG